MRQQGFALAELCVVLAICAILSTFAFQKMQGILARVEVTRITAELYQLCLSARAKAAHIKLPLTLCGSRNGLVCDHQWATGALLFIDKNRNHILDADDSRLEYRAFQISPATLKWQGFGEKVLSIEGLGIPFASNGSFSYCSADKQPVYRRQVIVNRSGRVRVSMDRNGDGIHEAADGGNIDCE